MAKLKKIVEFLDDYLEIDDINDGSWNGLQFQGDSEVKKIAFAVSAGADVFKKAEKEKPEMIIVHHGIFWKNSNPSIKDWQKKRIQTIFKKNISLYGCHLPLDRHPVVGNNVQILKLLKAKIEKPFVEKDGKNIGWIGKSSPSSLKKIVDRLDKKLETKCFVLNYGKKKIERIGVVSGGAPYSVFEAIEKKVDLYITGDPADIMEVVKDAEINVIFAGHYATETLGLKALSEVLEKKFKIKKIFIDAPTGL